VQTQGDAQQAQQNLTDANKTVAEEQAKLESTTQTCTDNKAWPHEAFISERSRLESQINAIQAMMKLVESH